jgi:hypothetical protein
LNDSFILADDIQRAARRFGRLASTKIGRQPLKSASDDVFGVDAFCGVSCVDDQL